MKKLLRISAVALFAFIIYKIAINDSEQPIKKAEIQVSSFEQNETKKTPEEKAKFHEARVLHEYNFQVNPQTGEIPLIEKQLEKQQAVKAKLRADTGSNARVLGTSYVNRGPSNLGGRTRSIVVDRSDNTGNTIISGGVSSGVFRTTDGGASWTKVSSSGEIHNVTSIVQDPRTGFASTWYYGTGEANGNTASLGSFYLGRGIWKSTDSGVTWTQLTGTNSTQESYDSFFDIIFRLAVHPTTGDLFAAVAGQLKRFDLGTSTWSTQITNGSISTNKHTDVVITSGGRVYAGFSGNCDATTKGVWSSANGESGWARNNTASFTPAGRVVIALAPSNESKLYVLFDNGTTSDCNSSPAPEANLWMWNQSNTTYTNYSSKLPDEVGCSDGNDPFAIQGGYDLAVSVKPNDENFVVIGGTNAYKKADITAAGNFLRIGGYNSPTSYAIYNTAGGVEHHPDIHTLVFSPFNSSVLFTGSDGGVHRTSDVTAGTVDWASLNNNYQTQQYYHVAIDPLTGSDRVIGGLQDNGSNSGGTGFGEPDLTTQTRFFSGDGVAAAVSRDDVCLPLFVGFQNGPIYRSCPSTWTLITPAGSASQFVTYFYLDPDNNKALYYAGKGVLYRTNDATSATSATWTNLGSPTGFGTGDTDEWFQTFSTTRGTYSAGTSYLLMGGNEGHIYRLDDPQNATDLTGAVNITPATASTAAPTIVTGLAIHPTNRDIVLATYSNYGINNIYLTTNATNASPTWTLVERNLSAHSIRSAAITLVSGEVMYFVGTARGLYSTSDPTSVDWTREAPTQIGYAVVSAMAYRPADNQLLIGTHGNGMFMATITSSLGVNDNELTDAMKVFPNPTSKLLNIELAASLGKDISFNIYNVTGQLILNGRLKNNQINVSHLQSGLYFIEIASDGKKGVKRFIKK